MGTKIEVLDHGYVEHIESWGHGLAGLDINNQDDNSFEVKELINDYECGIIEAARQSTQGSFRGWERDERLLRYMYDNKHATPFEFAGMVIEVQAPIFVFREWQRHRTQSYNEMSARYAPLPLLSYVPTLERTMRVDLKNRQAGASIGSMELTHEAAISWIEDLQGLYVRAEEVYQKGLSIGIPKELARVVVPVGRYSRMRASANLRNWLAFMTLRMAPNAQWEIRQFANTVAEVCRKQFPKTMELFDNK